MDVVTRIRVKDEEVKIEETKKEVLENDDIIQEELGIEENTIKGELENEKVTKEELGNEVIKKELENEEEIRKAELENEKLRNVKLVNEEMAIKKKVEVEKVKKEELENEEVRNEKLENEEIRNVKLENEEVIIQKQVEHEEGKEGDLEDEQGKRKEEGVNEEDIRKEEGVNEVVVTKEEGINEVVIIKEVGVNEVVIIKEMGVNEEGITKEEGVTKKSIMQEEGVNGVVITQEEGVNEVVIIKEVGVNEVVITQEEGVNEEGITKEEGVNEEDTTKEEGVNEVVITKEVGVNKEDITKKLENYEVQSQCNAGFMNVKLKEEMIEYEEEGSESKRMVDKKRRLDVIDDEKSVKRCKQVELDQELKSATNPNSSTEVDLNVTEALPMLAEIVPVVSNNNPSAGSFSLDKIKVKNNDEIVVENETERSSPISIPDKPVKKKSIIEEGKDITEEEESVIAWFEAIYVYPSSSKEVIIESTGIENEEDKILRTNRKLASEYEDELIKVMSQKTDEEETILPSIESIEVDRPVTTTSSFTPVTYNSSIRPATITSSIRPMTNTNSSYSAIPTCTATSLNPSTSFSSGISEQPTVISNRQKKRKSNQFRELLRSQLHQLVTSAGINENPYKIKRDIFNIRRQIRKIHRGGLKSPSARHQRMNFTNIHSQIPTENTHWMNPPNQVSRKENNFSLRDSPSYNGFPRRSYEQYQSDFNGFSQNGPAVLPFNEHNRIVSDHLIGFPSNDPAVLPFNEHNGIISDHLIGYPPNVPPVLPLNQHNRIVLNHFNEFPLNDNPNRIISNSNEFPPRVQNEFSPRQNEIYVPCFTVPDYQSSRGDYMSYLSRLHPPTPNEFSTDYLATTSTQHECPHTRFAEYSGNFQPEYFEIDHRSLSESTEPIEYQDFNPQRISLPDIRPYEYDSQDSPSNYSQSEYLLNDPRIHRIKQLERRNTFQFRIRNPEPHLQLPSPRIPSTVTASTAESTEENFVAMRERNNSRRIRRRNRALYFQKRKLKRMLKLQRKADERNLREMQLNDPNVQLENRLRIYEKECEYNSKLMQGLTMPLTSGNIPLNFQNNNETEEEED